VQAQGKYYEPAALDPRGKRTNEKLNKEPLGSKTLCKMGGAEKINSSRRHTRQTNVCQRNGGTYTGPEELTRWGSGDGRKQGEK